MLLSKATYIWGLNQTSHREEAITTQKVLKTQSWRNHKGGIQMQKTVLIIIINKQKGKSTEDKETSKQELRTQLRNKNLKQRYSETSTDTQQLKHRG